MVENILSRLARVLDLVPCDANATQFAVRSHAAAAALYSESVAVRLPMRWNVDGSFTADSIEIARTSSASLMLARYRPSHVRAATLVEANRHATLVNLGLGSLDVLIYRTVDAKEGNSRAGRQLLSPIFRTLAAGEVIAALAGREVIDVIPTQETVAAWILSRSTDNLIWEYDRQTGASISCRDADEVFR